MPCIQCGSMLTIGRKKFCSDYCTSRYHTENKTYKGKQSKDKLSSRLNEVYGEELVYNVNRVIPGE